MTKKIGVGIIGAGGKNIATDHQLPASLQCPSVNVVALADINPAVEEYAGKYNLKAYRDLPSLINDPEVDMIQISTPDWVHCEQALAVLNAGKYALLQKPPCLNLHELQQLRECSARHPRHLKVLLNNRETPLARTLRHCVATGLVGEVRAVRIKYRGRRFPVGNPDSPYLKVECGGVWIHNGLHWLDEACAICGKTPGSVQAFTARNENGRPELLGDGPNYWSALFDLEGVNFLFEYNTMLLNDGLPGGMHRAVIGTEGELRVDYGSGSVVLFRNNVDGGQKIDLLPPVYCDADPAVDSFIIAIENFARQIIDEKEQSPAAGYSLALMDALLSASQSAKEGSGINLRNN